MEHEWTRWLPWRQRIRLIGLSSHASRQWGLIGLWLLVGAGLGLWYGIDLYWPPSQTPRLWQALLWVRLGVAGVLWLCALMLVWRGKHLLWVVWLEWLGWLALALYLGLAWAWSPASGELTIPILVALLLVARGICIPGGVGSLWPVVLMLWGVTSLTWLLLAPREYVGAWRGFVVMQWATLLAAVLGYWAAWRVELLWSQLTRANRLDRYRIVKRMQTNGMSRIEIGWHEMLERPCIIKRLPGSTFPLESEVQEFRREAELVIWVQNPHVVRVFDFGETREDFYLAMEYLLGINLHKLLIAQGPLPQRRVVFLMRQICEGLAAVHEQGILHRDIKPSNLFLTVVHGQYDFVKVIDFGIAQRRPALRPGSSGKERIPGTPAFMAPERYSGQGDIPSEIYALGVLLYTLLAGQPPFRAASVEQYHYLHTSQTPPLDRLKGLRPDLLPQLADVIARAMAKSPEHRFSSAEAMKGALDQCQQLSGVWRQEEAQQAWQRLIQQRLVDVSSLTALFPDLSIPAMTAMTAMAMPAPHREQPAMQTPQQSQTGPWQQGVHGNIPSGHTSEYESSGEQQVPSLVLPDWDELHTSWGTGTDS